MERNDQLIYTLNNLIRINLDRAQGYQHAVDDLKPSDIDLKTMFTNMATTSTQFAGELRCQVTGLGGEAVDEAHQSGQMHRVWMDLRAQAGARSRKSILSLCEFGEDAVQRAYHAALEAEMPDDVRQVLKNQNDNLKTSHDLIKRYRDMQAEHA